LLDVLPLLTCLALAAGSDAGTAAAPALKAIALISTDSAVLEKWVTLKPAERAKLAGLTDKLKVDERVVVGIALDGYTLPKSRLVDLTCDVVITDPTGQLLLEKVSIAGTRTWDPKTQSAVPLKPTFGLIFGTTDPEGVYKMKITVWDQVRGVSTVSESTFTVSR
jgi:hypothetical protein